MKKALIIAILFVSIIVVACTDDNSANSVANEKKHEQALDLVDNQQNSLTTVDKLGQENVITVQSIADQLHTVEIKDMGQNASDIIIGELESISYKSIEGSPWTEFVITVVSRIKGSMQADEQLLLYTYGGQISLQEYLKSKPGNKKFDHLSDEEKEKTIINISLGEEMPEVGKQYVFFVIPTPDFSPLPSRAYEKVTVGPGTNLELSEDGLTASRIHPDTGLLEEYYIEEIVDMIN